jgi:hypothetical protein
MANANKQVKPKMAHLRIAAQVKIDGPCKLLADP